MGAPPESPRFVINEITWEQARNVAGSMGFEIIPKADYGSYTIFNGKPVLDKRQTVGDWHFAFFEGNVTNHPHYTQGVLMRTDSEHGPKLQTVMVTYKKDFEIR